MTTREESIHSILTLFGSSEDYLHLWVSNGVPPSHVREIKDAGHPGVGLEKRRQSVGREVGAVRTQGLPIESHLDQGQTRRCAICAVTNATRFTDDVSWL